jgi:hypothetical protein
MKTPGALPESLYLYSQCQEVMVCAIGSKWISNRKTASVKQGIHRRININYWVVTCGLKLPANRTEVATLAFGEKSHILAHQVTGSLKGKSFQVANTSNFPWAMLFIMSFWSLKLQDLILQRSKFINLMQSILGVICGSCDCDCSCH